MGYYVEYDISGLVIPKERVDACLDAINGMFTDDNLLKNAHGGCWGGGVNDKSPVRGRKWYSWVTNPPAGEFFKDLKSAFGAWRFCGSFSEEGDFNLEYFEGEKLGDESFLFDAIAPFVAEGSTIEARGEDGAIWRHVFAGGKVREQQAKISWED